MAHPAPAPISNDDPAFISYVRADGSTVAEALSRGLALRNTPAWRDVERLRPGEDWDRMIDAAIAGCSVFVYVITAGTRNSDEARGELIRARQFGRRVIPVLAGDPTDMPRSLLSVEYVDCRAGVTEDAVESVLAAIVEAPRVRAGRPGRRWMRGLLIVASLAWVGCCAGVVVVVGERWMGAPPPSIAIPPAASSGLKAGAGGSPAGDTPRPDATNGLLQWTGQKGRAGQPTVVIDKDLSDVFKRRLGVVYRVNGPSGAGWSEHLLLVEANHFFDQIRAAPGDALRMDTPSQDASGAGGSELLTALLLQLAVAAVSWRRYVMESPASASDD